MIVWYSRDCESCSGNHALAKIKSLCKKKGLDFQERRVIFWDRWEKEANDIIELNEGLKLPFFFETTSQRVLRANSLTPLDSLEAWIDKCLKEPYN